MNVEGWKERSLRMPRRHAGLAASILALRLVPGYEYYCRGELQLALRFVRREVHGEPDNGAAWELLGLVLRDTGQPLQAADALERASLLHCIQPLSRICLAECYAVLKRRELAGELYLLQAEQLAGDAEMLLLLEERSHAARVIDRIGKEQIEQLTCRCCLERIAALYKEIGNEISHRTCQDRLRAIDSAGSELQSRVGDFVYEVNASGVLYGLDLKTGQQKIQQRAGVASIWATPIATDGQLYLFGRRGETSIIDLATHEVLNINQLWEVEAPAEPSVGQPAASMGGSTLYAVAVASNALLLRRGEKLFAVFNDR